MVGQRGQLLLGRRPWPLWRLQLLSRRRAQAALQAPWAAIVSAADAADEVSSTGARDARLWQLWQLRYRQGAG